MAEPPRLTTVMGVARAVLATVPPTVAARALREEFGWDATVQALAVLPGPGAREAFEHTWSSLVLDPLDRELPETVRGGLSGGPRGSVPR